MDRGIEEPDDRHADAVVGDDNKLKRAGLEEFLRKYAVDATDQISSIAGPSRTRSRLARTGILEPAHAHSPENLPTLLSRQFQTKACSAGGRRGGEARRFEEIPAAARRRFEEMLVWADDKPAGLTDFNEYFDGLVRTRRINELEPRPDPGGGHRLRGDGRGGEGRMVVFGDTEFLSNFDVKTFAVNYDLFTSSVEWMSGTRLRGALALVETAKYSFGTGASLNDGVRCVVDDADRHHRCGCIGVWLMRRR